MKKNLFIAAMSLLVLAGCSNDDEINNLVANNENAITFDTYVGKVTKAATAIQQDFGVFAYEGTFNLATSTSNFMFNQKVAADGTYGPTKYWPGTEVSFIAYAPYEASVGGIALNAYENTTTGLPSMNFTLSATADVDLLVSDLQTASSGSVPLLLKHALAKVTFSAGETGDAYTAINITSITLKTMSQTGVLTFGENDRTWGTLSKTDDFAVTEGQSYLLIPQALANLKATVAYTITTTDSALPGGKFTTTKSADISLTTSTLDKWETSKQYNYTIKPTLDRVSITATIEDWTTAETPTIPNP